MSEQQGTVRTCRACGQEKLIPFRKHKCVDCADGKATARVGGKKRGRRSPPPRRTADSLYHRPGGMGFSVQLEVDANTGVTDVRLSQYNPVAEGDQTLWLNQLEARELQSWLAEHLGEP